MPRSIHLPLYDAFHAACTAALPSASTIGEFRGAFATATPVATPAEASSYAGTSQYAHRLVIGSSLPPSPFSPSPFLLLSHSLDRESKKAEVT